MLPFIASSYSNLLIGKLRFFIWGKYNNAAVLIANWNWVIQWTPAFIGTGMLYGMNTAVSFFAGNVICYAIIGPILAATGTAVGKPFPGPSGEGKWARRVNYFSLTSITGNPADLKTSPSPRYWLLWP
jgi:uncharacterized oligopeptide transporter (OPT) family protein